ncbi:M13 family metallopeptidase [Mycoplasmopsis canis]|uniref:M13 family metallopeptidase n=1 Tax=Mycoplasmopsis canis TaxID=29555 RepID=UPI00025AF02A|nr:M13 family metallopeptidase [Mycoplasmopsis canis]EIE40158.1 neutral endopeptidase (Endopeptidase O) [Mycoplasmopsis canis UF33]
MKPSLKDNYFEHINHEWLKEAKIPEDRSSIGSFVEMDIKLEKLLKETINNWYKNPKSLPEDKFMHEYIKFYSMVIDNDKREELGWSPIRKFLSKIEEISSFKQLFELDRDFWMNYSDLPFDIDIFEDFIDNSKKILWISNSTSSILPAKETYADEKESNRLIEAWKKMVLDLLIDYGKSEDEANDLVSKAVEYDLFYKDFLLSSVEQANFVSLYNLQKRENISKFSSKYNLFKIIDSIFKQEVQEGSVVNINFFNNFDNIFDESRFESFKAHMFIFNLLSVSSHLSEKIRLKANEFKKALYSIDKSRSLEDFAFDKTNSYFGMPLGMYYARTFFGEEAKKDVEHMVWSMIDIYKKRLEANTWLSKETIKKAIQKLSKMEIMVGYPEIIRPYYSEFKVKTYEEGGNIFENVKKFSKIMGEYKLSLYLKSEDKRYWSMSPATINAYYSPLKNHIVFPAAILSWPFYSLDRSSSANYGGIGAVIAHEISHGFDNNGSQFDEKGSLNNWWTDQDREEFKSRTKAAIELFDGRETKYGKVNGTLTVSENIADLGGFACALESAALEKDYSIEEFFKSWATIWRSIYKEGAAKRRLETDVHSPAEIRANVILANSEEFAKFYDINENNKMYVSPEKRVKIW